MVTNAHHPARLPSGDHADPIWLQKAAPSRSCGMPLDAGADAQIQLTPDQRLLVPNLAQADPDPGNLSNWRHRYSLGWYLLGDSLDSICCTLTTMPGVKEYIKDFDLLMASVEERASLQERLTKREKQAVKNRMRAMLKKGMTAKAAEDRAVRMVKYWRQFKDEPFDL